MGRVAGGYSVYAKKILNLGLYPESFREALSKMRLEYFTAEELSIIINGKPELLLAKGSLVESLQSFLTLPDEKLQGYKPFSVTQGDSTWTIPIENFDYSDGYLQLKVVCKVFGPTDINSITLTDMHKGHEEVLAIRPEFLPTIVDISSLPTEIQYYLRIDEICVDNGTSDIRMDASNLASVVKSLCETYSHSNNSLHTMMLGKSLVLDSASKVSTHDNALLVEALGVELRASVDTLHDLAQKFLVEVHNENNQ